LLRRQGSSSFWKEEMMEHSGKYDMGLENMLDFNPDDTDLNSMGS